MAQGQNKIQIKFEAKGNQALRQAILQLAKAQGILERDMKKVKGATKELNRVQDSMRQRVERNTQAFNNQSTAITKLQSFIAQYRNKLLLAAFAVTAYQKTVGKLTDLYATQELAEKKLAAALGFTSTALLDAASAMQENSTYGDEVTIQAMAQVAAFTKNESAIAAVASAAQDMASAKGMDVSFQVCHILSTQISTYKCLAFFNFYTYYLYLICSQFVDSVFLV